MNNAIVDVVFINPDSSGTAYQELSSRFAAIEPPTWALLLAESVRTAKAIKDYGSAIPISIIGSHLYKSALEKG